MPTPQTVGETAHGDQVDDLLATIPLSGMRGIASRTQRSLQETAQLSANWESDVTELLTVREEDVARADTLSGCPSCFVAALVYAVRRVPGQRINC